MKKILSVLLLITFVAVLMVPNGVLAQAPDRCTITNETRVETGTGLDCDATCVYETNSDCGMCCVLNTLYGITDWIFVILMALAVIFVIMGAFNMVTAAGAPEKVSKGRDYILYAAIGIVVALLARAIPAIVKMVVG